MNDGSAEISGGFELVDDLVALGFESRNVGRLQKKVSLWFRTEGIQVQRTILVVICLRGRESGGTGDGEE